MKILKHLVFFSFLFIIFLQISCKNDDNTSNIIDDSSNVTTNSEPLSFQYTFEFNNQTKLFCGDSVPISFSITDSVKIDSILLFINDKRVKKFTENFVYNINSSDLKTGIQIVKIKVFSNEKQKNIEKNFTLYSDIVPENKTYKVIKTYNHDKNAYTQGLYYDKDNIMYEATGLETKSSVRKVNFETGEVLNSMVTPNNVFGEGITVFNDKIYQITWQDHIAYVFNKDDFSLQTEFNYSTEGWGLTNDDTYLYMSDGTNNIYKIDPNTFSFVDKIQVYDNKSRIMYLNELEMINGKIYANVYMSDYIVVIDVKTGKVLEKIDLSGILDNSLRTQQTDVLNGIAYDKENNRIFVTGKNWPRLFQIEIIDK